MPKKCTLACVGYVALAVADTALAATSGRAARRARFVTKPLLMPTLTTAFTAATDGHGGRLATGTRAAQALSWGGDVALLGNGDTAFLTGLGSFFAGHLGYLWAFTSARDRTLPLVNPGTKTAAALVATVGPALALAAGREEPRLRGPVAAYAGVLAGMVAGSTMLDRRLPARARRTVLAGTTLFLASDTILGVREFLVRNDSRALDAAVMATYTAGQGLIAAGVAQAVAAETAAVDLRRPVRPWRRRHGRV